MPHTVVRIGLIQTKVSDQVDHNLVTTEARIAQAASAGAEIVCLEELFATRYFPQWKRTASRAIAERIPGRLSRFLAGVARKYRITLIGGSIYEQARSGQAFNTTLIYDPRGRRLGKYRKMHIPHDPGFYEKYYFAPGNLGYVQVATPKGVIAPLICYDQWFPEAARINALRGAVVIFYPTAIGWSRDLRESEPSAAHRWQQAMSAHASMNGVFTVAVNRVGREGDLTFWGRSFVADPFGDIIARASATADQALVVDIDLGKVRQSQRGWGFLENRRPESYRDLVR